MGGARGTALVGVLITGLLSWVGACIALTARTAPLAAGPLKGSGPVGRLFMAAIGIAGFAWGAFNAAQLTVDAIRDPLIADVSVERVLISSCSRCMESEIVTREGPRYMTVYGWKIWSAVPSRARLLLGAETGRILWLEAR